MSKTTFVTFFLLLLLFLLSTVRSLENVAAREAAVRDVFREMLHITPPEDLSAKFPAVASPPKHMVELYNKYASKRGPTASSAANTVRNILPTKGKAHASFLYICSRSVNDGKIYVFKKNGNDYSI